MIEYHRAQSDEELYEILQLQKLNLIQHISRSEQENEGFVTVQHTFDVLKKMNAVCKHCIAKAHGKVVGYALCMDPYFKNEIDILKPMFQQIEESLKDQDLLFSNYIAMGQVCVDKNYRKKGIFRGLYNFMKKELKSDYTCIITEVDSKNIRSSKAHLAIGFELLKTYIIDSTVWELVVLKC